MNLPKDFKITNCRIPLNLRSPALYYYELRHDEDWGKPESIAVKVIANFYGTLTSTEPIKEVDEMGEVKLSMKNKNTIMKGGAKK